MLSAYGVTFFVFVVWGSLVADGQLPPRGVGVWWRELLFIVGNNAGVLVGMYVGCLLSVGLVGVFFFAVNGFVFGTMLGSVPVVKVPWVLLYAPLELGTFAFAFLGAREASLAAYRSLAGHGFARHVIVQGAYRVVVAFGLLLVAALLEVVAIQGAWSD